MAERWDAFTPDEREALLRFGHRQAAWESVPDTAFRILKCDSIRTLAVALVFMSVAFLGVLAALILELT